MYLRLVWYSHLYISELQKEIPLSLMSRKRQTKKQKPCDVWCKFVSGRFSTSTLFVILEYYFKSCGLPGSYHFPYLTAPFIFFFKEKTTPFSWYPCQGFPGTGKINLINWWTRWSWGCELDGVPVLGVCSLKEGPGHGSTNAKGRDLGSSLRPVGKADNSKSRGFSGFLKSIHCQFFVLRFHSFWHFLCLDCLSHSVMFVDWMNDVGIC